MGIKVNQKVHFQVSYKNVLSDQLLGSKIQDVVRDSPQMSRTGRHFAPFLIPASQLPLELEAADLSSYCTVQQCAVFPQQICRILLWFYGDIFLFMGNSLGLPGHMKFGSALGNLAWLVTLPVAIDCSLCCIASALWHSPSFLSFYFGSRNNLPAALEFAQSSVSVFLTNTYLMMYRKSTFILDTIYQFTKCTMVR